jgi:hypothetical protein
VITNFSERPWTRDYLQTESKVNLHLSVNIKARRRIRKMIMIWNSTPRCQMKVTGWRHTWSLGRSLQFQSTRSSTAENATAITKKIQLLFVAALRWADSPSKKSYQMPLNFIVFTIILNGKRPENLTRQGRRIRRRTVVRFLAWSFAKHYTRNINYIYFNYIRWNQTKWILHFLS